ncbi:MAG TPA: VTT domain-containing protein, partial [Opitutaceae bacterium]
LTYWLARYALRPLLSRLVARYGYTIPKITRANALSATLALRLTPGPPFFLQSYILGLAEIPFKLYIVTSLICQIPWGIGFIVLGKGVFNGNFRMVMYGIGVLVVAGVVVNWLRRSNAARNA